MSPQTRVALVTGSSSGIGLAVARRLHDDGWRVVLNGKDSQVAGEQAAAELGGSLYIDANVGDSEEAAELVESAVAAHGSLDLVINNAGVARSIPHADMDKVDDAFWNLVMDVNLKGPWNVTKAARKYLYESRGQVINTASLAGMRALGSSIPYAVSKAGLIHLTRLLANALGPEIRVNAVAPGLIDTPWTRDWEDIRTMVANKAPARRLGQAEDVAEVMMGLITMEYTTGAIIPVTGGSELA